MDNPTTDPKPLGALLPGIVQSGLGSTASPPPSTTCSSKLNLAALPKRLDDATCAELRGIVAAPLPLPQCSDELHLARCLKALDILPRRSMDEKTAKIATKLYQKKLAGYSNEALSYLVDKGLEQFQWYPTIAECLDVLRDWPNAEIALDRRTKAQALLHREMQHRQDGVIAKLERRELTAAQIAALPDHVKQIGWTKALLWRLKDGTHLPRPDPGRLSPEELDAQRAWVRANMENLVLG